MLKNAYICFKRVMNEIKNDPNLTYTFYTEFGYRWKSIERKFIWRELVINEWYVTVFSRWRSINSWNEINFYSSVHRFNELVA